MGKSHQTIRFFFFGGQSKAVNVSATVPAKNIRVKLMSKSNDQYNIDHEHSNLAAPPNEKEPLLTRDWYGNREKITKETGIIYSCIGDPSEQCHKTIMKHAHTYTRLSYFYLAAMGSVGFTSNVFFSMVAPILPDKFISMGIPVVWIGMVFAMFSGAILIFSPLMGKLSEIYGLADMLTLGLLIQGVGGIVFGYSIYLTNYVGSSWILVLMLVMRTLQGVGAAACNLAVFTMVADHFKNNLGTVMGLNEVIIGMGFSLGPTIGAVLEAYGGFHYPFLVASIAILLTIPVSMTIDYLEKKEAAVKKEENLALQNGDHVKNPKHCINNESNKNNGGKKGAQTYTSLLTHQSFLVPSGFLFLGTMMFGIFNPIYTMHSEDFLGLNQIKTGYMFGFLSFIYSVFGVPSGWYADKNNNHVKVCFYGALISGFSFLCFGLRPIEMNSDLNFIMDVGFIFVFGIGQAGLLIPTLPAMQTGCKAIRNFNECKNLEDAEVRNEDNNNDTAIVVALFNIFQQGGLVVGPILGASINEYFGFQAAMLSGSLITLGYCCVTGLMFKIYSK
mmetsp:Transcript_9028/g.11285  ORF Transcript_9028/g.11285 Transcript_9028/m.11285 type:complete len:558 (-) Transcript_9028:67-1740(-)